MATVDEKKLLTEQEKQLKPQVSQQPKMPKIPAAVPNKDKK